MDTQDYITIPLSKRGKNAGKFEAIVSIEDLELASLNWSVLIRSNTNYVQRHTRNQKPTSTFLHRQVMERVLGRELKTKEHIDHINGNGLDNRRENLRIATQAQNCANQSLSSRNKSGYKGVSRSRNKWQACISLNGKTKYLGVFTTPELAYEAYCKAADKYFGDFANFG